jgi:hypothetical protein
MLLSQLGMRGIKFCKYVKNIIDWGKGPTSYPYPRYGAAWPVPPWRSAIPQAESMGQVQLPCDSPVRPPPPPPIGTCDGKEISSIGQDG